MDGFLPLSRPTLGDAEVALAFAASRARSVMGSLSLYAAAPLSLMLAGPALIPLPPAKTPGAFLEAQRGSVHPETLIISDSRTFQAVAWQYRRSDVLLLRAGEIEYGLGYADARQRLLRQRDLRALIGEATRERDVVLIVARGWFDAHAEQLPPVSAHAARDSVVFALYAAEEAQPAR